MPLKLGRVAVEHGYDRVAPGHSQGPAREEVPLDIDNNERVTLAGRYDIDLHWAPPYAR
jgi:hypothetical protein